MRSRGAIPKGVFISYRRGTTSGQARALNEHLTARYGDERVFMDVDSIMPGADFVEKIAEAVASCGVVLALIGNDWARHTVDEPSRLEDPDDFVRLELSAALEHGVPVIPILVERATMPSPADLPEGLRPLSRRNALELENARWDADVARLTAAVERQVAERAPAEHEPKPPWRRRPVQGALIGVLLVIAIGLAVAIGGGSSTRGPNGSGASASSQTTRVDPLRLASALLAAPYAQSELPSVLKAPAAELSQKFWMSAGMTGMVRVDLAGPDLTDMVYYAIFDTPGAATAFYDQDNAPPAVRITGSFSYGGIADATRCDHWQYTGTSAAQALSQCQVLSGNVVTLADSTLAGTRGNDILVEALASSAVRHLAHVAQAVSAAPVRQSQLSPAALLHALTTTGYSPSEQLADFQSGTPFVATIANPPPSGVVGRTGTQFTYTAGRSDYANYVDDYVFGSNTAATAWFDSGLARGRKTGTISASGFGEPSSCVTSTQTTATKSEGWSSCYVLSGNVVIEAATGTFLAGHLTGGDDGTAATLARLGLIRLRRIETGSS